MRASAQEAYEVRVRRLATGHDVGDASPEAEAGALLRAEEAHNIHALTSMVHAFLTKKG